MRPKKRLGQYQTARMNLRRKDHIEFVLDDTFHNAIWMSKVTDRHTGKKSGDELGWLKTPHHYMPYVSHSPYGNIQKCFGYMDIDDQFAYGIGIPSGTSSYIVKLKDYVVLMRGYTTTQTMVSENGAIWDTLPTVSGDFSSSKRFGDNGLIQMWNNSQTSLGYNVRTFEKDENGKYQWKVVGHSVTKVNSTNLKYICYTDEGCIVSFDSYNSTLQKYTIVLYELKDDGIHELNSMLLADAGLGNYCQGNHWNNFYYFVNVESVSGMGRYYDHRFCLYWSTDKYDWHREVLWEDSTLRASDGKITCAQRNTSTYIYSASPNEFKIFKKSDFLSEEPVFEEVILPSNMVFSCRQECGAGTQWAYYEHIQLKFREENLEDEIWVGDTSFHAYDLLDWDQVNDGWMNIFFEDGKLDDQTFAVTFRATVDGSVNFYLYVDNLDFNSGGVDSFMWQGDVWINNADYARHVMEGDYS